MDPTAERSQALAYLQLDGRVCVVTGGGSGIGAETARHLGRAGAWVAVLDRDEDSAVEVARQIDFEGGRAIGVQADVGKAESVSAAADRVARELGPCRVLVNNAAIRHREALRSISLQSWDRLLSVNLTGALLCTQHFCEQMIAAGQGGSLIHVASLAGHHPQPESGSYSVSKAGLIMLSRALAVELGPFRIRSNTLSPGFTRTPANEGAYRDPVTTAARERSVPAGRVGTPADMAEVIAFLASDRSSYIDGQDIPVDGAVGRTLMYLAPRLAPDQIRQG